MNNREKHNSIITLTKLGVYLALMLVGGTIQVLAQNAKTSIVDIDPMPLRDLAASIKRSIAAKALDTNAPFAVELKASLTREGRIDAKTTEYTKAEGDANIIKVVKETIAAVGESGWFAHLKGVGSEIITVSTWQNSQSFNAVLKGDAKTPERAKTIATSLKMLFSVAATHGQGISEQDKLFLRSTTVRSDDSVYMIELAMPATVFQEMIKKELDKSAKREQK